MPDVPVLANTGIAIETVGKVLELVDGVIVGSALKIDGDTWNPVDAARAAKFMNQARIARND